MMNTSSSYIRITCLLLALLYTTHVCLAQNTASTASDESARAILVEETTLIEPIGHRGNDTQVDQFIANAANGHFTWGVDVSSGVDLTSHDMTDLRIAACFGFKGGAMRFAGIGAAIKSMMNNSSRAYPIYAMMRTSFSKQKKPCFMEVQAGVSVNALADRKTKVGFYGALGVGFTLARSRNFSSHFTLSTVVMPLSSVTTTVVGDASDSAGDEVASEVSSYKWGGYTLVYAQIGIGCSF